MRDVGEITITCYLMDEVPEMREIRRQLWEEKHDAERRSWLASGLKTLGYAIGAVKIHPLLAVPAVVLGMLDAWAVNKRLREETYAYWDSLEIGIVKKPRRKYRGIMPVAPADRYVWPRYGGAHYEAVLEMIEVIKEIKPNAYSDQELEDIGEQASRTLHQFACDFPGLALEIAMDFILLAYGIVKNPDGAGYIEIDLDALMPIETTVPLITPPVTPGGEFPGEAWIEQLLSNKLALYGALAVAAILLIGGRRL